MMCLVTSRTWRGRPAVTCRSHLPAGVGKPTPGGEGPRGEPAFQGLHATLRARELLGEDGIPGDPRLSSLRFIVLC